MTLTCANDACKFEMKAPQFILGNGDEAIPLPSRLVCPRCFQAVPFKWDQLVQHFYTTSRL